MQVGGCATPGNLPFFMAVCDYYLMGEEIYAASAWTSGNMEDLGVVVGEDYPKLLSMILIIIGAILTTIGSTIIQSILQY
jgi:hypothetical protein